eukprot:8407489-Alexandrium_andersonii.AAC.1
MGHVASSAAWDLQKLGAPHNADPAPASGKRGSESLRNPSHGEGRLARRGAGHILGSPIRSRIRPLALDSGDGARAALGSVQRSAAWAPL